jgi:hypothetical protein
MHVLDRGVAVNILCVYSWPLQYIGLYDCIIGGRQSHV